MPLQVTRIPSAKLRVLHPSNKLLLNWRIMLERVSVFSYPGLSEAAGYPLIADYHAVSRDLLHASIASAQLH